LLISIPLALSAFIHLWNPVGFPGIHYDEGIYMRRAFHVLEGQGPQEPGRYDHPYFGQLFLAGVFRLLGYPDSIDTSTGDIHSIENLYMVPRVLMGLLAVVDTFLIYKISQYRYNRNVALIASILFAVMPLSWLTRRIYLDSIQLPFLLSSILFAVYPYVTNYNKKNNYNNNNNNVRKSNSNKSTKNNQLGSIINITTKNSTGNNSNNNKKNIDNNAKNILMIILSGVFLGTAIFTKIPAFTMIPMVGFLVYMNYRNSGVSVLHLRKNENKNKNTNNNSSKKSRSYFTNIPSFFGSFLQFAQNKKIIVLALWIIPVILIPAIWPAYAISIGQFHKWTDGIHWQASQRVSNGISGSLFHAINNLFQIDPVLLVLGLVGMITATIKKDFFPLLWIIPFFIFLYLIGFVSYWHLISVTPAFCIAAALLIVNLSSKIRKIRVMKKMLAFGITSVIGAFGLISTIELIIVDENYGYLKVQAFIAHQIPDNNSNNKISIIGNPRYLWIPLYVFHKNHSYDQANRADVNKTKALFLVDNGFLRDASKTGERAENFRLIYDNSRIIAMMKRPHFEIRITNIPIISAKGNIASLQDNETGKPLWILSGVWTMNINNTMQSKQSQIDQAYFNKTTLVIFHASFAMVNIVDGIEKHTYKISNFKITGDGPINNAVSSTFNGTAIITTDKDLIKNIPITIKIMKGRAISIWLPPKKGNNQFWNGPIYGDVTKLS
jgi:hypothetical protein